MFPQSSLTCIGSLMNMKTLVLEFLTFLLHFHEVILAGRILNICEARYCKLMFHFVLSYEITNTPLQNRDVHLKYLCFQNNLKKLLKESILRFSDIKRFLRIYYDLALVFKKSICWTLLKLKMLFLFRCKLLLQPFG